MTRFFLLLSLFCLSRTILQLANAISRNDLCTCHSFLAVLPGCLGQGHAVCTLCSINVLSSCWGQGPQGVDLDAEHAHWYWILAKSRPHLKACNNFSSRQTCLAKKGRSPWTQNMLLPITTQPASKTSCSLMP